MQTIFKSTQSKNLIIVDMEVTLYIGINLDWEYMNRSVTLPIPNYVRKDLHRLKKILMGGKEYPPPYLRPNPIWTEN